MMNSKTSIAYGDIHVWDRLAQHLESVFEPRPSTNCGRMECVPGWLWRVHLTDYDLWLAVKGTGCVRLPGHVYRVRPGTLLFLRPGDSVSATQDDADCLTVIWIHLSFYVPGHDDTVSMNEEWLPSRHIPLQDFARMERMLSRVVHLMKRDQRLARFEAKLALQQALLDVYGQDAAQQGLAPAPLDPRLERIIDMLRSRPSTRLSLDRAAETVGLSPVYLSRLFREQVGKTFRAYTVQVRLERAHHLLEESDMSVSQIAHAMGYNDLFLFSRQFKQFYGYPPSHMRK